MSLSPNPSVSLSPPLPSEVSQHEHAHGRCPIVDPEEGPVTHVFCPKQEDDSRSPCPALNALANHGYLPRNGRNITCHDLVRGMETAYGCSRVLSNFITYAGITLLGQIPPISLSDLARHNHIEHNASLVHSDADEEDEAEYAPTQVDEELLEELVKDSHDHRSFSIPDLSRARVRREWWCCHAIDDMHKEIAKGEVAMIMGIFGSPSCSGSNSPGASTRNSPLGSSLPLPKIEEDAPFSRSPKAMPSELESRLTYESRGGSGSDNSNSSDSAHVHTLTPTHQHHHRKFFHKKEHPEQYFTIPLEQATTWLREERLPDGWQPQKCGMSDLFENLTSVRRAMRLFQKELSEKRKNKGKSGGGSHGDDVGDGLKAVERLERETKHDLNGEQDQQEQHWYHPHPHLKLKEVVKELEGFHIHRSKPVDA